MTEAIATIMTVPETKSLSARIAYENRWLKVREHVVRHPDGSEGLYGVVERNEFAVILPLLEEGDRRRIMLVQQYRFPVQQRLWELPMGMWEERPETRPEVLAVAELREETGLLAARMEHVGTLLQAAGYSNQRGHVFLATGLSPGQTNREVSEQGMICAFFTVDDVEAMICDGRITCMVSIASFGMLRLQRRI